MIAVVTLVLSLTAMLSNLGRILSAPVFDKRAARRLDSTGVSSAQISAETRFQDHIQARGLCDQQAIIRAKASAAREGIRIDEALVKLGLLTEDSRTEAFAAASGWPVAKNTDYPSSAILPDRIRRIYCESARLIPLSADTAAVTIAMEFPFDDFPAHAIEFATKLRVIRCVARPIDIDAALAKLYPRSPIEARADLGVNSEVLWEDAHRLTDLASATPVIGFVNRMIATAYEGGATDIHVEPLEDRLQIRFRRDGVLYNEDIGIQSPLPIISRIKIMARLDISERRLPQDGRLTASIRGAEIDVRVSTSPGPNGETIVLRLFNQAKGAPLLDTLEMPADILQAWRRALRLANGLVLVTGPTGCGKTTTIAASLREIANGERNVITIEDPIEYQIANTKQKQVKPDIGLTFSSILTSSLRHDPDVLVVGEIRDAETAKIALQAALTGHLVISTLHSNSACGSITRLVELGIPFFMIKANLRTVLAQRLVRCCCLSCTRNSSGDYRTGQPACPTCHNTGYSGRRAVFELLSLNRGMWDMIGSDFTETALETKATRAGMISMAEMGAALVKLGITTKSELERGGVLLMDDDVRDGGEPEAQTAARL